MSVLLSAVTIKAPYCYMCHCMHCSSVVAIVEIYLPHSVSIINHACNSVLSLLQDSYIACGCVCLYICMYLVSHWYVLLARLTNKPFFLVTRKSYSSPTPTQTNSSSFIAREMLFSHTFNSV